MGVTGWGTRTGPSGDGPSGDRAGLPDVPLCDAGPLPCERDGPPDVARTVIGPGHEEAHRIPRPERPHPRGTQGGIDGDPPFP